MKPRSEIAAGCSMAQALAWSNTVLESADLYFGHGTDNAADEALLIACHAVQRHWADEDLLQHVLSAEECERLEALVRERVTTRKPAAYLTGSAWFAGMEFIVDERCLVPRSPVAELIERGFSPWLPATRVSRVLDLCCGGGCIGIATAMAFPEATVDLVDLSGDALAVATLNVAKHALSDRVNCLQGDLFEPLGQARYELIVSNPPYVDAQDMAALPAEYQAEPAMALEAGHDGLDLLRRILARAGDYLTEDGLLVVELGNSWPAADAAWPEVPFMWLEFKYGGHGVFAMTAQEWRRWEHCFTG